MPSSNYSVQMPGAIAVGNAEMYAASDPSAIISTAKAMQVTYNELAQAN